MLLWYCPLGHWVHLQQPLHFCHMNWYNVMNAWMYTINITKTTQFKLPNSSILISINVLHAPYMLQHQCYYTNINTVTSRNWFPCNLPIRYYTPYFYIMLVFAIFILNIFGGLSLVCTWTCVHIMFVYCWCIMWFLELQRNFNDFS